MKIKLPKAEKTMFSKYIYKDNVDNLKPEKIANYNRFLIFSLY